MRDPSSILFQIWQDSNTKGLPLLRHFYFWNLTNPYEVMQRTQIPDFVKVGPYVYQEHLYSPMESIRWSPDQTQIDFNYFSDLQWVEELSVDPVFGQLSPNDTFTTINLALWAASYRLGLFSGSASPEMAELKQLACDTIGLIVDGTTVGPNGFFIERRIHDFLFGYEDDVWAFLQLATKPMNYSCPSKFKAIFNHSQPAPSPYTFQSGLKCPVWDNMTYCNSSGASTCTIYSGVHDVSQVAQYVQWSGQRDLWWWTGEPQLQAISRSGGEKAVANECQQLRGSNAMSYPPGLTTSDAPYVFVDDIFRSVRLEFVQHYTVKDVPTLQFRISEEEKRVDTPLAKCFDQRYPAVFNLTRPYFAPMLVSQPYFWGIIDPQHVFVDEPDLPLGQKGTTVLNFTINGTHINDLLQDFDPSDAELVLRIEPHTGALMEGRGRIQMGTWMRPITINECGNVFPQLQPNGDSFFPYTMMPILYLDRTVVAPDSLASSVYNMIVLPILLSKIIGGIMAAGGAIFAGVLAIRLRAAAAAESPSISEPGISSKESSALLQ
jgi:hypothetical protein